jgi:serine protease Do
MSLLETMRKQKLLSFTLLLFTLSIGILIGTLMHSGVNAAKGQAASDATPLKIPDPVEMSTAFSQLAKRLGPSVVNITTEYIPKQEPVARIPRRQPAQPDEGDQEGFDLFRRFFQGPLGDLPQMPPRAREGTASGVIVDAKGYILTNNHVVYQADTIKVRLSGDETKYDAKLVGTDRETDLAVIKINAPRSLPPAKIGNSDAVQVGDWAVAIGSPFELEATVTAGIISAKEREVGEFQHFLQTDAAINPGNSGGPLLNINGEVIGINTAIVTNGIGYQGYQGVGFALPINTAVQVYNQIIKTGRMTRGSIGVGLETKTTPELLKVYGASQGAFVNNVERDTPADRAGLKEADVIVSMNGKPIKSNNDLISMAAGSPIGSSATLGVIREGKKMDVRVTIGDRTEVWRNDPRVVGERAEEPARSGGTQARFGMSVQYLGQAERQALGSDEKGGVKVTRVEPGSFADDIGLEPNDVITSINRQPVNSFDDLRRIQNTLKPGDAAAFRVLRAKSSQSRGGNRSSQYDIVYLAGTLPNKE